MRRSKVCGSGLKMSRQTAPEADKKLIHTTADGT